MPDKRIAWAITGAGHALQECVQTLRKCRQVDIFLSRAGEEVVRMYELQLPIDAPGVRIYRDETASAPLAARFFGGVYCLLVVAPATSNSVAKFVHGISDNLVTNLFAQAGKSRVPIIVYPTDLQPEMNSLDPRRAPLKIFPRPIDLMNTEKLRAFAGVQVVGSREELERCIAVYL